MRWRRRRISHIVPAYYGSLFVSTIFALYMDGLTAPGARVELPFHGQAGFVGLSIVLSLFLCQTYVPGRWTHWPNGPCWTISTLMFHWQAYPFLSKHLTMA